MNEKIFFVLLFFVGTGSLGFYVANNQSNIDYKNKEFSRKIFNFGENNKLEKSDKLISKNNLLLEKIKKLNLDFKVKSSYLEYESLLKSFFNNSKEKILSYQEYQTEDYYNYLKSFILYSDWIISDLENKNIKNIKNYFSGFKKITFSLSNIDNNKLSKKLLKNLIKIIENIEKERKKIVKTKVVNEKSIVVKSEIKKTKIKKIDKNKVNGKKEINSNQSIVSLIDNIVENSISEVSNLNIEEESTNFIDNIISSSLNNSNNNNTKLLQNLAEKRKQEKLKKRQEELKRLAELKRKEAELARKAELLRQKQLQAQKQAQQAMQKAQSIKVPVTKKTPVIDAKTRAS